MPHEASSPITVYFKLGKDLNQIAQLIASGKLRTVIVRRYALDQIQEAHAYVEKGLMKGNVIVMVSDQ